MESCLKIMVFCYKTNAKMTFLKQEEYIQGHSPGVMILFLLCQTINSVDSAVISDVPCSRKWQ